MSFAARTDKSETPAVEKDSLVHDERSRPDRSQSAGRCTSWNALSPLSFDAGRVEASYRLCFLRIMTAPRRVIGIAVVNLMARAIRRCAADASLPPRGRPRRGSRV